MEWKTRADRVPMTRDAKLIAARQLGDKNDARLLELATPHPITQQAVAIDPSGFVERRLQALVLVLGLDADAQAELELRYQELIAEALEGAAEQLSAAVLTAPQPPMNRDQRRHPAAAGNGALLTP